ncbi:hypothetical protein [Marinobacterium marinum]|uniref:Uncharacterized protein n=1 Tax=Marinobacterium marinum TaxID=2756129 RepID=A0A7W2ABX5_9GAMM|nr:hypothetical protein [Marinobacterium marinum]MBA4503381.1 hypothetical protein [Marinobacterium marinum]
MKRIFISLILITATGVPSANADIRLQNGKVLVSVGDPVAKLNRYLEPVHKHSGPVCHKPSNHSCRPQDSRTGMIYEYHANRVVYTVQTYRKTITYVEWRHQ